MAQGIFKNVSAKDIERTAACTRQRNLSHLVGIEWYRGDGEPLVGRLDVEVGVAGAGEVEQEVRADAGVCSHDRHLSRFREDDCWEYAPCTGLI